MPVVHAAVDGSLEKGAVRLRWKGEPVYTRSGPYRITLSDKLTRDRWGYPSSFENFAVAADTDPDYQSFQHA